MVRAVITVTRSSDETHVASIPREKLTFGTIASELSALGAIQKRTAALTSGGRRWTAVSFVKPLHGAMPALGGRGNPLCENSGLPGTLYGWIDCLVSVIGAVTRLPRTGPRLFVLRRWPSVRPYTSVNDKDMFEAGVCRQDRYFKPRGAAFEYRTSGFGQLRPFSGFTW